MPKVKKEKKILNIKSADVYEVYRKEIPKGHLVFGVVSYTSENGKVSLRLEKKQLFENYRGKNKGLDLNDLVELSEKWDDVIKAMGGAV